MSRNMQNEIRMKMKKIPLTEAEIEAVLEAIDRRDAAIRARLEQQKACLLYTSRCV